MHVSMSTVPNSVFTWSASASMSDSEAAIAPRHHQPMVSEEPPGAKAITIAALHMGVFLSRSRMPSGGDAASITFARVSER